MSIIYCGFVRYIEIFRNHEFVFAEVLQSYGI